jgi:hypothetical protein
MWCRWKMEKPAWRSCGRPPLEIASVVHYVFFTGTGKPAGHPHDVCAKIKVKKVLENAIPLRQAADLCDELTDVLAAVRGSIWRWGCCARDFRESRRGVARLSTVEIQVRSC